MNKRTTWTTPDNTKANMQTIFPAHLDSLSSMLQWIRNTLITLNVEGKQLNPIELACEEALINIIKYSYPDTPGHITLSCERKGSSLIITLIDTGLQHNPLNSVQCPIPPHIGGYGILIMLHLMDKVDYRYVNGCNELTLIKDV